MARCLHRVCGREFSGVTAFDRHLRWSKGPPWVSCQPPESVGLVETAGIWGYQGLADHWRSRDTGAGGISRSSVAHKASGAS